MQRLFYKGTQNVRTKNIFNPKFNNFKAIAFGK